MNTRSLYRAARVVAPREVGTQNREGDKVHHAGGNEVSLHVTCTRSKTYLEPCWTAVLTALLPELEEEYGPFVLSSWFCEEREQHVGERGNEGRTSVFSKSPTSMSLRSARAGAGGGGKVSFEPDGSGYERWVSGDMVWSNVRSSRHPDPFMLGTCQPLFPRVRCL